ncbi:MAG: hypothetical protein C0410_13735, partial [Anaerolinea sp.]|nr:hypothetical protein [Anaerolinea sp.]
PPVPSTRFSPTPLFATQWPQRAESFLAPPHNPINRWFDYKLQILPVRGSKPSKPAGHQISAKTLCEGTDGLTKPGSAGMRREVLKRRGPVKLFHE